MESLRHAIMYFVEQNKNMTISKVDVTAIYKLSSDISTMMSRFKTNMNMDRTNNDNKDQNLVAEDKYLCT